MWSMCWVLRAHLGLLFWVAVIELCAASGPATIMASDCCENSLSSARLPPDKLICGWYWTSTVYCRQKAVIFVTHSGRKVCGSPAKRRTRLLMEKHTEIPLAKRVALRAGKGLCP
ncbi:K4.1 [Human gammaherpesvirus 8]|uniref:Protein vCCL3 n=2 Tax=Human herpesvirus 8 TaxID=37296 RepID=VCCL3_HHV8P|nr:K4.1 [Human gammaherpesvirus 8]F5HCJ2.1 RecName: Full=Protein vCCL3; Flags: Precursor [Human herpesvirus 8 strain GK18]ANI86054.1 K4.1 [synthetic construct]AAB62672.1 ORF K4.1 [Human gammaherpesvirus 8]AAC56951.1 similar to beta-chemokine genes [Human gammaherpesvirus 8]ABD28860.1 K4.1 [Human gammaherpesvirus 8]ACY00408.1 K4.1 [Human gammaherpesvirus 8]